MKKILSLLLAVVMVFGLMTAAFAADADLAGKTVVLHTNDVHGQVDLYAKVAALKKDYEAKGADVILVDAGDYAQGTPYVSETAIELMNAAGYDVVTLGNHEFDYGYANLQTIMKDAKFKVVCNIKYNGKLAFDASYVVETKGGLKVGFLGLTTPETSTKAHPAKIKGVTFMAQNALYSFATQEAADLKAGGSDVVIALTHLGVDPESKPNRSTDLYANAKGIDFIIDGHSHTKMTEGENGEPIQSTETKLKYVGVVVIDNATKKIESNELIQLDGYANEDADTKAAADAIITDVDARLGAVFAKSEVELNGKRDPGVRTQETNLAALITDALLWYATKDGKLDVPADHIVAVTNGGGIRASIKAGDITMKDINTVLPFGNTVAVVSDGSAVLGLGDIGPEAGMPVMEGKCVLFKEFGNVNAVPICLDTQDTEEIIKTVKNIAPGFGGINLEDISAPRCFEIEERLKEMLDIPVFHDDQHGTAIVVLAGIINALKVTGKEKENCRVVVNGAGSAGVAITKLLLTYGFKNVIMCDRMGIIGKNYPDLNWMQKKMTEVTNLSNESGTLADALKGADIFVGVSAPNIVTQEMVASMNKDAILFAMANPTPEIMPDLAKAAGAKVVGTGRSDFPNQVNNVVAFPGIFKGALEGHASQITEEMKLAAAKAIAGLVSDEELNEDFIMPEAFDPRVAEVVSQAVKSHIR